jgi:hypothetical protein
MVLRMLLRVREILIKDTRIMKETKSLKKIAGGSSSTCPERKRYVWIRYFNK